ncbi:MAG TPA: hypothetical protein VGB00_11180 [Pyrinomonadaceae bacterium]|jgi:hypothetical protein
MNKKSILIKSVVLLVCLLSLSLSAAAQRRKTPARKTTPKTATVATAPNMLEVRDGAQKVSVQIKNVTKFIYLLGGVARVIEDLDKEIRAGKASRSANDLNARNKQGVVQTIKKLREGLASLEVEFRTKPALRAYLVNIQGISDMSGVAEDQALNGQLTESGKTLLLVVEKLSDTLAALP